MVRRHRPRHPVVQRHPRKHRTLPRLLRTQIHHLDPPLLPSRSLLRRIPEHQQPIPIPPLIDHHRRQIPTTRLHELHLERMPLTQEIQHPAIQPVTEPLRPIHQPHTNPPRPLQFRSTSSTHSPTRRNPPPHGKTQPYAKMTSPFPPLALLPVKMPFLQWNNPHPSPYLRRDCHSNPSP